MDAPVDIPATDLEGLSDKQKRRLERGLDTRTLDPWERYRALTDLYDSLFDVTEFADRKARFALLIMGALNALNFVIAAQPRQLDQLLVGVRSALGLYVGVYAVLSLYLFWQAIEALRPRPSVFTPNGGPRTRGLRFMPDLLETSADGYLQRWNETTIGQLNREMALHAQALARVNELKFKSLHRVYDGLLALTFLSAALFTVIAFKNLFG